MQACLLARVAKLRCRVAHLAPYTFPPSFGLVPLPLPSFLTAAERNVVGHVDNRVNALLSSEVLEPQGYSAEGGTAGQHLIQLFTGSQEGGGGNVGGINGGGGIAPASWVEEGPLVSLPGGDGDGGFGGCESLPDALLGGIGGVGSCGTAAAAPAAAEPMVPWSYPGEAQPRLVPASWIPQLQQQQLQQLQ